MTRFKALWSIRKDLGLGADAFGGPETGFFGRYKNQKRYVGELRFSF